MKRFLCHLIITVISCFVLIGLTIEDGKSIAKVYNKKYGIFIIVDNNGKVSITADSGLNTTNAKYDKLDDKGINEVVTTFGNRIYSFSITSPYISSSGFKVIQQCTQIETFSTYSPVFDDSAGEYLADCTKLKTLRLTNSKISGKTLRAISRFVNLKVLCVENTNISDSDIGFLKDLVGLETLALSNTKISDRGIIELCNQNHPALKSLILNGLTITDDSGRCLKRIPTLVQIWVEKTSISKKMVDDLIDTFRKNDRFFTISSDYSTIK